MKKLILLAFIVLFSFHSFSQCNFISDINFTTNYTPAGYKVSGMYSLPANYKVYNQYWKQNGNIISSDSLFDYGTYVSTSFPGINELCLYTFFTDTITGDSCMDTHCEIVSNDNAWGRPNIDVAWENGLDIQFVLSYPEGNYSGSFYNYFIDYGDGTTQTLNQVASVLYSIIHSYPQNGTYTITVTSPFNSNSRTINVGSPNLKNIGLPLYLPLQGCDTNIFVLNSNSPTLTAYASIWGNNQTPIGTLQQNSLQNGDTIKGAFYMCGTVPIRIDYGFYYNYPVVVSPSCIAPPDTIYGFVWHDINFNGLPDAGESSLPNATISVWNYNAQTDSSGNYSILVPHIPTSLDATLAGFIKSFPQNPYNFNFPNGTGHYNYNFGFTLPTQVCGKAFIDANSDSIFTTNIDYNLQNTTLQFRDTTNGLYYYTSTNISGEYCTNLPYGNYVIKPVNYILDSAIFFPDSITVNLSGTAINNKNFAFTSNYSGGNFNILLNSAANPRPGFGYSLITRLENSGIDSITGNLVLNFDSALNITSINPAIGIVDTANHLITWNTGLLQPSGVKYFTANFIVPVSTQLGYLLTNSAYVIANPVVSDHDTTNNATNFNQFVIGSYDPNDKSVYPNGYGSSGDVHHETRLNYRINFQNTGTASAINIIVQDTIDADLDMNTFLMHRSSHAYNIVINDNIITWKFSNINLPDSNSNEPLSHGYIEYSIKPKQGLPDGATIENNAQIYFDFNSPISTNTTLNTLQTLITSLTDVSTDNSFSIFPNPNNGNFKIQYHLPRSKSGKMEVFDINGKIVFQKKLFEGTNVQNFDLFNLPNGIYNVLISSEGFRANKKLVIIK